MSLIDDVQAHLQSEGLIDGTTGWPSFRRRLFDGTAQAPINRQVVLTEDGGVIPESPSPAGSMGDSARGEAGIQIRVRGEPWDGDGAAAKIEAIYRHLHGLQRVTLGANYYIRVYALTSGAIFLGFDDRSRPEFTWSFRATYGVDLPLVEG